MLGTVWLLQFQASMRSSIIELISVFFFSQLLPSCQHRGYFQFRAIKWINLSISGGRYLNELLALKNNMYHLFWIYFQKKSERTEFYHCSAPGLEANFDVFCWLDHTGITRDDGNLWSLSCTLCNDVKRRESWLKGGPWTVLSFASGVIPVLKRATASAGKLSLSVISRAAWIHECHKDPQHLL